MLAPKPGQSNPGNAIVTMSITRLIRWLVIFSLPLLVVMLVICFISGQYINLADAGNSTWYALLYLIVFGSLLAYSAYVIAISKLPPTLVSVYAYINPVVAIVLGWLLLREKMNTHMIFGTVITLAGIYLVKRESKKQLQIIKQ